MRTRIGHGLVALALAAAGGCAASDARPGAGGPQPPALGTNAEAADAHTTQLLVQALPDPVGHEARVITVDYPPGGSTPPHRHPGAIFAYVVSGEVVTQLDNGATAHYGPGQAWYERQGQLHSVSRNASATEPARLLVFYLTEPGAPVLTPEH